MKKAIPSILVISLLSIAALVIIPQKGSVSAEDSYCTFSNVLVTKNTNGSWHVSLNVRLDTLADGPYDLWFNADGHIGVYRIGGSPFYLAPLGCQPGMMCIIEYSFDIDKGWVPFGGSQVGGVNASLFVTRMIDSTGSRYCTSRINLSTELNPGDPGIPGWYDASEGIRAACAPGNINSAIGCFPFVSIKEANSFLYLRGTFIAGGIAFLMMIFSGFQMMSSRGDPEKYASAKELFTAAVSGLVLIIFSAFLLRIITVDLLGLFS